MLQLDNRTPYQAERGIQLDVHGAEHWVVVVKATFKIEDGSPVLADEQEPVCLADKYFREPGVSSMKYENELVLKKPGTDIVVNGHAYAPKGRAEKKVDARVSVGKIQKTVRVYGNRIWKNAVVGLSISNPELFEKMPLVYERAFGGVDLSSDDPKKQGSEDRNPIGVGFGLSADALKGMPLPNLEEPGDEIKSWKDRPTPAGFGLICKHWMPRRQYAGTCDQQWMEERLPLYPLDFNYRFFLGAHPDLVSIPHLRGGESVELINLTPDSYLAFELPRIALGFRTLLEGKWVDHAAKLGSVIIEPDIPRVIMVMQSCLPCHRKGLELEETEIREKAIATWN